mmetsp:Transcript_18250/g.34247  ORF Transcript_18250/g.34247 Transcript_18250/m.34247 type:complete len:88 (-) Transcript_18250:373-636(-)
MHRPQQVTQVRSPCLVLGLISDRVSIEVEKGAWCIAHVRQTTRNKNADFYLLKAFKKLNRPLAKPPTEVDANHSCLPAYLCNSLAQN